VPNLNNPLSYVGGFAIDGDRALVTQHQSGSVFAVDLVTNPGNRTIFSDATTPDVANPFVQPRVIAVDSANGRALVADSQLRSLFAMALADGTRTVVSRNEPADIGYNQLSSTGVALDLDADRIYVTDPHTRSLIAVNLATGDRTRVSSDVVPFGPIWNFPNGVALDAPNNRAFVVDGGDFNPAVYRVELDTGARSVLSENATQTGIAFDMPQALAIDPDNDRVLVTDFGLNAVVAVSLTSGARTKLSEPFTFPSGIVVDETGDRALVTHLGPPSVVAVDLVTGAQSVLSTAGNTGTWLPMGIGIDAATRTIVTGDEALSSVHVIDPVNGARTLVSSPAIPRPNDKLTPRGVAVDASRRIAWVTNGNFAILQIVDLVTGERVFLTR
jgi:DNA-binding beta-propeller fold protein YncE